MVPCIICYINPSLPPPAGREILTRFFHDVEIYFDSQYRLFGKHDGLQLPYQRIIDAGMLACETCYNHLESFCEVYNQERKIPVLIHWRISSIYNTLSTFPVMTPYIFQRFQMSADQLEIRDITMYEIVDFRSKLKLKYENMFRLQQPNSTGMAPAASLLPVSAPRLQNRGEPTSSSTASLPPVSAPRLQNRGESTSSSTASLPPVSAPRLQNCGESTSSSTARLPPPVSMPPFQNRSEPSSSSTEGLPPVSMPPLQNRGESSSSSTARNTNPTRQLGRAVPTPVVNEAREYMNPISDWRQRELRRDIERVTENYRQLQINNPTVGTGPATAEPGCSYGGNGSPVTLYLTNPSRSTQKVSRKMVNRKLKNHRSPPSAKVCGPQIPHTMVPLPKPFKFTCDYCFASFSSLSKQLLHWKLCPERKSRSAANSEIPIAPLSSTLPALSEPDAGIPQAPLLDVNPRLERYQHQRMMTRMQRYSEGVASSSTEHEFPFRNQFVNDRSVIQGENINNADENSSDSG